MRRTGVRRRQTCPVTPSPTFGDRYGTDVLNDDWRKPKNGRAVEISADLGLVVEEVMTDWCGEIVAVDRDDLATPVGHDLLDDQAEVGRDLDSAAVLGLAPVVVEDVSAVTITKGGGRSHRASLPTSYAGAAHPTPNLPCEVGPAR